MSKKNPNARLFSYYYGETRKSVKKHEISAVIPKWKAL